MIMDLYARLPWWMQILAGMGAALFALFRTLKFVNEAEQGVRLRFGKAVRDREGNPKILEPGFLFIIPFVENLMKHHTREQPLTLSEQEVILKDNSVFHVGAAAYYRVNNVYRLMFDITDVDTALKNACMGALRDVVGKLEEASQIADTEKLSEEIFEILTEKAERWGLELTSFKIMNCAPTAETASYLNAGAAVKARAKALEDAGVNDPQMAAALLGAQTVNTVTSTSE